MTVPAPPRAARFRYAASLIALVSAWLAMLVLGGGPLDHRLYEAVYAGDRAGLASVAHVLTALGEPTVLIAASVFVAVWLWFTGHHRLAPVFFAVTAFARVFTEAQKNWIGRPRPDLETHLVVVKSMSFPSGHATSSMVFYVTLALVLTEGSRSRHLAVALAVLLSIMVGLSRVMLGVHWPSDVVGGWAFGLLWVLVTLRMAQRFVERGSTR